MSFVKVGSSRVHDDSDVDLLGCDRVQGAIFKHAEVRNRVVVMDR